ncbi:unnamed protein product [Tuber aestivum]|uniref:Uncharacterized protein n=1 Tax=Tuber aestivum TaxID=59557 RepID=A0A292PSY4_9PEZI|nr:unnamed protein product [Tuber aestivum]
MGVTILSGILSSLNSLGLPSAPGTSTLTATLLPTRFHDASKTSTACPRGSRHVSIPPCPLPACAAHSRSPPACPLRSKCVATSRACGARRWSFWAASRRCTPRYWARRARSRHRRVSCSLVFLLGLRLLRSRRWYAVVLGWIGPYQILLQGYDS